jgi:uncharacterized protein YeeX (DUF496 family)
MSACRLLREENIPTKIMERVTLGCAYYERRDDDVWVRNCYLTTKKTRRNHAKKLKIHEFKREFL